MSGNQLRTLTAVSIFSLIYPVVGYAMIHLVLACLLYECMRHRVAVCFRHLWWPYAGFCQSRPAVAPRDCMSKSLCGEAGTRYSFFRYLIDVASAMLIFHHALMAGGSGSTSASEHQDWRSKRRACSRRVWRARLQPTTVRNVRMHMGPRLSWTLVSAAGHTARFGFMSVHLCVDGMLLIVVA